MKKTWNSPEVQELTIQATAWWGGGPGYDGRGGGRPGNDFDKKPSWGSNSGSGNSDLCRCDGGTSPCNKHHGWDEDFES
ncbi:MAG: hypothetical protein E7261_02225 [Lachnospiraceae bacterium]|nr:hypothetical protein [Lachnospiraceae bacterium]